MAKITIDVSTHLLRDIDKWAKERRTTRERAATELLRVGAELTSERSQQIFEDALAAMRSIRQRATLVAPPKRSRPS